MRKSAQPHLVKRSPLGGSFSNEEPPSMNIQLWSRLPKRVRDVLILVLLSVIVFGGIVIGGTALFRLAGASITNRVTNDLVIVALVALFFTVSFAFREPNKTSYLLYVTSDMVMLAVYALVLAPAALPHLLHIPLTAENWLDAIVLAMAMGLVWKVVSLVVAAIHESGHALAAQALGLRVESLRIGPLQIRFTSRGPRLDHTNALNGGFTAYKSSSRFALRRINFVVTIAASIMVFLLIAGGVLGAFLGSKISLRLPLVMMLSMRTIDLFGTAVPLALIASLSCAVLVAWATWNLIVNLLPIEGYDGENAWHFPRGDHLKRLRVLTSLAEMDEHGVRPRDWPAELISEAVRLVQVYPRDPAGFSVAYVHHLDRGEIPQAAVALDQAMVWNRVVPVEMVYFGALYGRDLEIAEQWLLRAQESFKTIRSDVERTAVRSDLFRAQAALCLAREQYDEALEAVEAGLAANARVAAEEEPTTGTTLMFEAQLQAIAEAARQQTMVVAGASADTADSA